MFGGAAGSSPLAAEARGGGSDSHEESNTKHHDAGVEH